MESIKKNIRRREFLRLAAKAGVLVGLGGAAGFAIARLPRHANPAAKKHQPLGKEFYYDIEKYEKTDPALIHYQQVSAFDPGFRVPRSIEVGPDNSIYVAGDRTVRRFTSAGQQEAEIKPSGLPLCLAATPGGEVFVGLKDRIEVYDGAGALKASWETLGPEAVIKSIALSGDHVFAADAGNRVVLRFDASGKLAARIGEKDEAKSVPGFVIPSPFFCVRIAPDGLLRVSNPGRHRIEAYTFDGQLESWWGKTSMAVEGFCGCCNPISFTLLRDGRYVTCEKGLPRVKVYDAHGSFECVVAGPESFPEAKKACAGDPLTNCTRAGLDVAADAAGRIYVLDPIARNVRLMEKKV